MKNILKRIGKKNAQKNDLSERNSNQNTQSIYMKINPTYIQKVYFRSLEQIEQLLAQELGNEEPEDNTNVSG
jgi:hypothetical protein